MSVTEKANVIIYRIREKGLEVFLVKESKGEQWTIPQGNVEEQKVVAQYSSIALEDVKGEDGAVEKAVAVEGDWHDIPSLKALIRQDVDFMKGTLLQMVPDTMEKGAFVAVKEAFKKVLPNQYHFLKELKDIITERNSTKDL